MLNIIKIDEEYRNNIKDNEFKCKDKIEVLIAAGGLGTRMKPVNNTLPKSLVSINKIPILYRQLNNLYKLGYKNIAISINKVNEEIYLQYLKDFSKIYSHVELNIYIFVENDRLGTLGILYEDRRYYELLVDTFIVIMGDLIFDCDIKKLSKYQINDCSIFCTKSINVYTSESTNFSVFNIDKFKQAKYVGRSNFLKESDYVGLGVYVFNKNILNNENIINIFNKNNKIMIDDDILSNCKLSLINVGKEEIVDVGIPINFFRMQAKLRKIEDNKTIKSNKRILPAVFLDRDGVINYKGKDRYVNNVEDMKVIPETAFAIKKLNDAGIKVFVVTNQAGIEKGFLDEKGLALIHNEMNKQLSEYNAHVDYIKYCESSIGFRRKPNPGMFLELKNENYIDLYNSIMIGDEITDKEAGINAGIENSYQIEVNSDINKIVDDYIIKYNCIKAAKMIIESYENNKLVLVAGNGGSNSDASHITTELLKSFINDRLTCNKIINFDGKIMEGIPIINLGDNTSFMTAYGNDVNYDFAFAQLINVYAKVSDLFIGITTSGNSENIINAVKMAKLSNMKVIIITSNLAKEKVISKYADLMICSSKNETYKIQEDHIKYYHYICKLIDEYLQEVVNG